MKLIIPSLKDDRMGEIFFENKLEKNVVIKKKSDIILHLLDSNDCHIIGYSLIRLNDEGLMKFKRIGFIGAHFENRTPQSLDRIDFDQERKLIIVGADII